MKKFLAILTLIFLALSTVMAYAEEAPVFPEGVTNADTATAELKPYERYFPRRFLAKDAQIVTGDPATDAWAISATDPSDAITAQVALMSAHVVEEPIVTFFDEAVQADIEANKPAALEDVRDLIVYELAALVSTGYQAGAGDSVAVCEIETEFEDATELVVMVGLPANDAMTWSVQKTTCNEQQIRVTFTEDELVRMGAEPALVLVLGVPAGLGGDASVGNNPSVSYDDMTSIQTEDSTWSLYVADPSELIEREVAAMLEHVATEPIATFFDEDVQAGITLNLPADVAAADELIAYELIPVACQGYKPEYNNVAADMTFATLFAEETELIVMIGLPKETADEGDLLTWTLQNATLQEGKVRVMFTEEELVQMETTPALLLIMSAPVAQ